MSPQLLSWLQPYQTAFNIISGVVTIVTFIGLINQLRGQLKMRTRTSWLILASGLAATLLVVAGICVGLLPAGVNPSYRVSIGNSLAIAGLGISIPGWLAAIGISSRTRRWVWLGALFIVGGVIYTGAIVYSDFVSYLAVGALPMLFGYAGPQFGQHVEKLA